MATDHLKLYTWGYAGHTQADLFDLMREHQIDLVVDVRQSPWSHEERWRKAALTASFGESYRHVPELGNSTRSAQRVQLVNEGRGLARLEGLLQIRRRVLIICVERDYSRCHRSYVAQRMQERIEGLEVAHL